MYMYIGIPIANARTGKKETRRAIWVSALVQAGVAVGGSARRSKLRRLEPI
jgi:hypothetical protein